MHVVHVASTSRPPTRRPSGNVPFSGSEKGQAVTALLAAYSHNPYPLIFDLTDGEVIKVSLFPVLDPGEMLSVTSCAHLWQVHHLLQLRDMELYEWQNLSPQQAYWKQAQLSSGTTIPFSFLADRRLSLESIPEDMQGPMKRLRKELRGAEGVLREQLDSVIPFLPVEERVETALAMISAWRENAI